MRITRPALSLAGQTLRRQLDENGYEATRIVAADDIGNGWNIVNDVAKDAALNSAVDIIG